MFITKKQREEVEHPDLFDPNMDRFKSKSFQKKVATSDVK